jgi:glutathione peroxidase
MTTLGDIPLTRIDGGAATLADYAGQVLLIVNVASRCGLTPQYEGLEALYAKYRDEGFVVLGFPANDFAGQEPGSDAEIADFCSLTYDVSFPLFAKSSVVGPDKNPLYAALIAALPHAQGSVAFRARLNERGRDPNPEPEILWNFEKFLIGRDGEPVARFSPDMAPQDDRVIQAIERELFASE